MKLTAEQVAALARCECQFIRTNSGDAVYVFTNEGLLRFAAKVAQAEAPVNAMIGWASIDQPSVGITQPTPASRIAELEAENKSLVVQVMLIAADRDKANRRIVDAMAELNGVKDANTVLRSERDTAVDNLGYCQANLVTLSRKVEEYEKLVKKVYETFGAFVL